MLPILLLLFLIFINSVLGSFLIDPFLLLASGILIYYLHKKIVLKNFKDITLLWGLYFLIIITFYAISISLYFNLKWVNWILPICVPISLFNPPHTGFDWMINSGVFKFSYMSYNEVPFYFNFLATLLFLLYPFWLFLGIKIGKKLVK